MTGVAGMIGTHLTKNLLHLGYKVHGIDDLNVGSLDNIKKYLNHKNFTFTHSKLQDIFWECYDDQSFDYFIHLAAHKKIVEDQSVLPLFETNVDCTKNIIEYCCKKNIKLIFASTSDVYGYGTKLPFSETDDIMLGTSTAKRWAYAVSKLYCEHLIQGFVKEKNLQACIIRYFGGFSESANFSWSGGHIPVFIDALKNNRTINIHGDGAQTRSIGHADDLSEGTRLVLENFKQCCGQIINIGNDEEISIKDSLYRIAKLMNIADEDVRVEYIPQHKIFGTYKDIMRRKPDLNKARTLLNYQPKITFDDAVKRVLKAMKW